MSIAYNTDVTVLLPVRVSAGFLPCRRLADPFILAGMAEAYRIIFALTMKLEGGWTATFPLDRRGQATPRRAHDAKDGMPHWPKKRTIDLRVGDQVFFRGAWHRILSIRATRDGWLSAVGARECREMGYIYRPRRPR